jgi:hypothetical protein
MARPTFLRGCPRSCAVFRKKIEAERKIPRFSREVESHLFGEWLPYPFVDLKNPGVALYRFSGLGVVAPEQTAIGIELAGRAVGVAGTLARGDSLQYGELEEGLWEAVCGQKLTISEELGLKVDIRLNVVFGCVGEGCPKTPREGNYDKWIR